MSLRASGTWKLIFEKKKKSPKNGHFDHFLAIETYTQKPLLYGKKSPQMREIIRKPCICMIYPLNNKIPKFQVIPISESSEKKEKMSILAIEPSSQKTVIVRQKKSVGA